MKRFLRNQYAFGKAGVNLLKHSSVCVLGVGGVGSFAVEALARSGVGRLILVDKDAVDETNINRQIHALTNTVGFDKVSVMADRIKMINPDCEVITLKMFYLPETKEDLFQYDFDFLVDACDTVTAKIDVITECLNRDIKFISSMGAGNKFDPTKFEITDITKTSYDPLAKVIRQKLRKNGIKGKVPVIYSKEEPKQPKHDDIGDSSIRKEAMPPSSNAFVPSSVGLIAASYVINTLLEDIL
jgi:tRNA A37 threonylcarbamoyladenosine dehydratase